MNNTWGYFLGGILAFWGVSKFDYPETQELPEHIAAFDFNQDDFIHADDLLMVLYFWYNGYSPEDI